MKKTLYDKLWDAHVVKESDDGTSLIYIDRQLLHEVTSPQAFEGLKLNNRMPWRIDANLAVVDHNIPTKNIQNGIDEPIAKLQVDTLRKNCEEFGITFFDVDDVRNGIVHVVGPEQGATLPGMTVVCGDSHTSTHGAIGALAFGIGTSEVEHVLSTQTLIKTKDKNMLIKVEGKLPKACTSKDLILYIIGQIGTAGGTGYAIEFAGSTIRNLSIESRLTICNMSIEAGARSGLVAVDDKTIEYFKDKPFAPKGEKWEEAVGYWKTLHSDEGAHFDKVINIDASKVVPQVTWGTSPEMVLGIEDSVPDPFAESDSTRSQGIARALEYMGLKPNQKIVDIKIDKVFIGSCTNSRIEDIRSAAEIVKGKTIASNIKLAMVVPGSGLVKEQAELEGLDKVFTDAGFEWRSPGCSMCLAMNNDRLSPLERCASTSNRNFEGRQGHGGRTHLVSPSMAAAAAIAGHFVDVRNFSSLNQDQ
ncbi:3-isopropylmalate dehydratase large subunit [Taylorella equigenitalis]|uniref:3-isopropylmalate dehydratase large subunit n=3 Tax=Taylorella equigenitalis TaxID=29575 RepID=A0A654KIV4_TAYEM|nr:3-isopropylmalate dehydratase large subunit [Taylorella equigenitalis]ADU92397.1 3-isopropylmalate dehydratase large subunit [Taylorella equigenitalis MCE9]AFN35951.1 LeuC2 protein [Taylorella equigenitalis ATCC 35865]ASY30585.1 3-isopropylmalate dehydratase large subunit [Taylorella equigenitalis]ASY37892.1 3-isopropylmalate dehydratase large subunit [Taylorella equigenitalis]ASY39360.1 3-isopropylmalate dehydratase large subunit [Taylorella equigenitalis]